MSKAMKLIAVITVIITIVFYFLYQANSMDLFLTLVITFGITAYHFCMRLAVGKVFDIIMNNKADYTKRWYQVGEREKKLYEKLKVKKWKGKMPTYDASLFDTSKHSLVEIVQVMCQSELVHETIIILSFVPIIMSIRFGALPVFLITSIFGAVFDMMFVMMQRYNRPRVIRLITK